ncbi:MAG: helix-turn-helix domain-containing protein [Betaproteobacteria bacterium]|nr:helix-turn-helix domain-containing protein [Betaproteobacteria bacterium]
MKTIAIGIMPQAEMRARALKIAKGQYKPKPGEPKIWFPSMRSVAEVLSDENRALLHIIRESQPGSLGELAQLTGRQVSNLSRTLKTMCNYGLVELKRADGGKQLKPVVKATEFKILTAA